MAGNRVVLEFVGDAAALHRTFRQVEDDTKRATSRFQLMTRAFTGLGTAGNMISVLGQAGVSIANLSAGAVMVPAAFAAAGAAVAAFKVGTAGFSDALKGDAEALAGLSPAAHSAADALLALRPAWDALQDRVQDRLFEGMAGPLADLGTKGLPVVSDGLTAIAGGWNSVARNAITAMASQRNLGSLRALFAGTASLIQRNSTAIASLITGFMNLAGAGGELFSRMGGGFADMASRFEEWTARITSDGSFQDMVARAGAEFRALGETIMNIGSIVHSIITGLAGPSSSLFGNLARVTDQIAAFLKSAEGQTTLRAMGDTLREVSGVLNEVLGVALKNIGPVIQAFAPMVANWAHVMGPVLISAIQTLAPILETVFGILTANPGLMTALVIGWMAWSAVISKLGPLLLILSIATRVFGAAAVFAAIQVTVVRVAMLLWAGVMFLVSNAAAILRGVWMALTLVMGVSPFMLIIGAIALIVVAFVHLWNNVEGFRNFWIGVWNWIVGAAQSAAGFIGGVLSSIGEFFTGLGNAISRGVQWIANSIGSMVRGFFEAASRAGAAIGQFVGNIGNGIEQAARWFFQLPIRIAQAVGNLGNTLLGAGRDLITGLWNGIQGAASWLYSKVQNFFSSLIPGWAKDFLGIGSPSKVFAEIGQWIPAGMAQGITQNADVVQESVNNMADVSVLMPAPVANTAGPQTIVLEIAPGSNEAVARMLQELLRVGKLPAFQKAT